MILARTPKYLAPLTLLALLCSLPASAHAKPTASAHPVSGAHILALTQQYIDVAPKRYIGSPGHDAAEQFIKSHFAPEAAKGDFITDEFYARTPIGLLRMRNFIVKYPGKKDGIIVLASHYETNYPLKDIDFVGANDGACTTALLIALGEYYRDHPPQGYSVWLVFDDGEEAIANPPIDPSQWTASNSLYGTRHLAAEWSADGTIGHIKAFIVADMIGWKKLNITREGNSTPWLENLLAKAGRDTGHSSYLFRESGTIEDDHLPFKRRGVPVLDVIDFEYGTPQDPEAFHHTALDTMDKLSAQSLQVSADLFLDLVRLISQR
ncbi:MAG TPA: M28 family peptidase [Acidobacteriaceae bacterium]|jgi:Zn-dependent M28 family amino/carboxypeptidase|nr:M28 family peptidase [Acidobacteriaceae bacterium]